MDDAEVARLCAAAAAGIDDARSELLAAGAVEWQGAAAERFGDTLENLLADRVRAARQLERARALVVAVRADAGSSGDGPAGAAWAG